MDKYTSPMQIIHRTYFKSLLLHKAGIKTSVFGVPKKLIEESYQALELPLNSKQDAVRRAFVDLAKKYHPDSGSPHANVEKFVAIEKAFRTLTKHISSKSADDEVEKTVHDIIHTAPQHRQYLSYEGVGYGTPSQRMKQWTQARAQRAADNVLEHRLAKNIASEKTLMKKGQQYSKKHDIKTKYGFDRLVEDLIQESISKGEFENLSGKGKPLKDQNMNPYVDFTTHKLNEVLINNGFTPEWITLNKEIEQDIELLKKEISDERRYFGPHPLATIEIQKWDHMCEIYKDLAKSINTKINTYNLLVPLLNKQRFHIDINSILDDILKKGEHSKERNEVEVKVREVVNTAKQSGHEDFMALLFKIFGELFKKKNVDS